MSTPTAVDRRATYAIIGTGNIGTALARLFKCGDCMLRPLGR
jgi:lactate dehydrogenase-like 2-hydroxyacid dehydrogenase